MEKAEMEAKIKELIKMYAPEGTTFKWFKGTRRMGYCSFRYSVPLGKYTDFVVAVSTVVAKTGDWEKVRLVALHEIAHARNPECDHERPWRWDCIAIGGDGQKYYNCPSASDPSKW
ncbi:hypothetical protein [Butyrivibrio sp. AE2032]|uniref:hypothetical protein n=1 Tax=Butyrivibrio sp. AE2032 TaxID=1458463 RepID=UPI00055089CC|nr:hypothetical protein [Butyrivibrio sp. AE2032]